MNDIETGEDVQLATLRASVRSIRTSPKFAPILGFIVGERITVPAFTELSITSDGYLIALPDSGDHTERGMFLGAASDLNRNLRGFGALLPEAQRELLVELAAEKIIDWRRAT